MICGCRGSCCTCKQWGPLFCDLVPYFLRKLVLHCLSGTGSKSAFSLPSCGKTFIAPSQRDGVAKRWRWLWWGGGVSGWLGDVQGGGVDGRWGLGCIFQIKLEVYCYFRAVMHYSVKAMIRWCWMNGKTFSTITVQYIRAERYYIMAAL